MDALDPSRDTFCVVLTFHRAQCPEDWRKGAPKPTWLFEQLQEELSAWSQQRLREEQWVSKEEDVSTVDGLILHFVEEMKRAQTAIPQNIATRLNTQIFSSTVLRLKELKERRAAGGIHSATQDRREKARKTWAEDEYEGPKREEEQRRQRAKADADSRNAYRKYGMGFGFTGDDIGPGIFEEFFKRFEEGWGSPKPPPASPGKKRWFEVLGVPASASRAEITKAYRRMVAKYHPDRYKGVDGHARMLEINEARDEGLGGVR